MKRRFSYRVLGRQVEGVLWILLRCHQHRTIKQESPKSGFVSLHEVFANSGVILGRVEIHSVLVQLPIWFERHLEAIGGNINFDSTVALFRG